MTRTKVGISGTAAIAALLIVGLLVGLTASASAGPGESASVAAKKKCGKKKGKAAGKKKCGKKKPPVVVPPVAPPAALSMSPAAFTFPDTQHQSAPCPACPTQAFTVTNTGGSASSALAASITETTSPVIGVHDPAYFVDANTCTAALAPGGTCTVTVRFIPNSNAGDGNWASVLHVIGSPGGDAQSSLSGHGD